MCIRDRPTWPQNIHDCRNAVRWLRANAERLHVDTEHIGVTVSYTHLRAHETVLDLVCRLLLEKKKNYKAKRAIQKVIRRMMELIHSGR